MSEADDSGAVREIRPAHGLVGVWWNWRLRNAEENARMMAGTIELQEAAMAPQPQRRENRKTHLDASVVPVERALIERAKAIDDELLDAHRHDPADCGSAALCRDGVMDVVNTKLAAEFRELAEELHYW